MNNEQLLRVLNDTRIVVKDMGERISKLEEENEQLKEIIKGCANWTLGDPEASDISGRELRDELLKWVERD